MYNQLCHDDMPSVRRSAALNLGKFAATVEPMYLKSEIMTFFRDLTQDGTSYVVTCTQGTQKREAHRADLANLV